MHILHLVHSFLPVSENWIYNQISFNARCRSTILCQYRTNEAQFPHDAVIPLHRRGSLAARCELLAARLRGRYRAGPALRVIKKAGPQLVHGHFAFESWRHLAAVRQSGLPLVTTFYGLDISMLPRRAVWRKRYAGLFSAGAAFIVEGDFMAARLAGLGCPAEKINCIPIGVDIEKIRSLPARDNGEAVRVLFVGLGREKKGASYAAGAFIAAAAKYPAARFDLVGDGAYRRPVTDLLRSAGILDKCTFHGMVPVEAYLTLLRSAAIVLAPSVAAANGDTEGGAPVTVIEAQAAGIPVVGTLHCDIPMVVEDGETGLLCAERDTAALAANLERLIADSGLRARLGAAAAKRAALRHDISRQVEKICGVYEKCLASKER